MSNMENIVKYLKNNKPFVVLLVGPPLSGKSTFIKKFKEVDSLIPLRDFEIISRDEIVMELSEYDDYNLSFDTVNHKEVDNILRNKFISANLGGRSVFVDMTNLSSKRRKGNLAYFDNMYTKVGIVFPSIDEDEFIRRNSKRKNEENKNISLSLWKAMSKSFMAVKIEEGFNKIFTL
jgi:predicted kinase